MIIEGKGRTSLTELEMQLTVGNKAIRFRHYVRSMGPGEYMDPDRSSRGYITFEDSREIDSLISMLEQFRKGVVGQVCDWRMDHPALTIQPWTPMSAEDILSKLIEKETV